MKVAIVSAYPPNHTSMSTFASGLRRHLLQSSDMQDCLVLAVTQKDDAYDYPDEVALHIQSQLIKSYEDAARWVNDSPIDLVYVQYGRDIHGGIFGHFISYFLNVLKKPSIVTIHDLTAAPSLGMKRVISEICAIGQVCVVPSICMKNVLVESYGIDRGHIHSIPLGIPVLTRTALGRRDIVRKLLDLDGRKVILSIGTIHPESGIEVALEGISYLLEKHPEVRFLVRGQAGASTKGEAYMRYLRIKTLSLRLGKIVRFNEGYLDSDQLVDHLLVSDLCINVDLGKDHLYSNVLAQSLGYGRAIISTPSPYAIEILEDTRGVLVPYNDPVSLARAMDEILSIPERRTELERNAWAFGQEVAWPVVARAYARLAGKVE